MQRTLQKQYPSLLPALDLTSFHEFHLTPGISPLYDHTRIVSYNSNWSSIWVRASFSLKNHMNALMLNAQSRLHEFHLIMKV